jgi:Cyclic nucleotide-binding domain
VPDDLLTRVLGILWGLAMGAVALGSIAAPVVVEAWGPRAAFLAVGAILPLVTLLAYRRLLEIDRAVAPAAELELIEHIPMFAPLSIATKERVAASLVRVAVPAGKPVITAGEVGDRFYIVGSGVLDVDAPGRHTTAKAADYFGEIALLRDLPRTATVRAAEDSVLYALERDDFLVAVTGHSAARAAGHEVVDARMAGV